MNEYNDNKKRIRVQIVTPVYNEEASLPFFIEEVRKTLFSVRHYEFQVLFIEDGSSDRSWEIIKDTCRTDPHFEGIRFSRNFGSHIALSAGFYRSDADVVCTLACDLQDPPEVILQFLEKWKTGAKIVWGRRRTRDDSRWRMLASNFFFRLVRRYAMPQRSKFSTGSFLLVDRQVADCFRQFHECNRITFAIVAWTGFDQAVVDYDRKQRSSGTSGWNFSKMIKTMYDAFIGFSFLPTRLMTLLGIGVSLLTIPLAVYLLLSWITGDPLPGWTGLMLALTFFFALQFLLMGIVGEYLYRIYAEVVRRPLYIISDKTSYSDASEINVD